MSIIIYAKKLLGVTPKKSNTVRTQHIKPERWGCNHKILHMESMVRLCGSGVLSAASWYNTTEHGRHMNRLTGFSTDFFQDDSIELAWRPSVQPNHFDIFALVRMGGRIIMHSRPQEDFIDSVRADRHFYFDIKHYIPASAGSASDENRIATFALNGSVKTRAFGVKPGWVGWVRNLRYRGNEGAPHEITARIDLEYNKIHD